MHIYIYIYIYTHLGFQNGYSEHDQWVFENGSSGGGGRGRRRASGAPRGCPLGSKWVPENSKRRMYLTLFRSLFLGLFREVKYI